MGVSAGSGESPRDDPNSQFESDCYSSGEESRLLQSKKEKKLRYPKSVFFIVGNEFCERFSYYGLRTILTLYLTQRLFYSENTATILYHLFTMLAYFTPLIGAIIADSWLGKFKTILYVSILYAAGCIVLAFGAFPNELSTMTLISLIGLLVIAIGTGGIKPCVSAFGGDQFKEGQELQLQQFFSLFYLSINLGSVFSTFITPILREDVHCLGETTCYPIAFGVPAILMVVALLLFICGKPLYVIRPPEGNIMLKVSKCIGHAISRKCKSSEKKKSHWLDYADDKYDKKLIEDIKIVLHVFVLYIPLPVFWALFDQMGSRWTLQATRMDGKLNGYHLKADQMQVLNPFLIISFIPLFDYVIYPLLRRCHILKTPLQRITTGGFLAAGSFILAGFIELSMESAYPVLPSAGNSQLTIINNSPCPVAIGDRPQIPAFGDMVVPDLPLGQQNVWNFNPANCSVPAEPFEFTFNSTTSIESMMITLQDGSLIVQKSNDTKTKPKTGEPLVRFFYNTESPANGNMTFILRDPDGKMQYAVTNPKEDAVGMSEYINVRPNKYKVYLGYNETTPQDQEIFEGKFDSGGIYIISIYNGTGVNTMHSSEYVMVKGNTLSILYQIPQYVIITAGEIMFSITGLEFSYSQSPTSMKSVVQAAWLMTVAFGNIIVMVITKLRLFEKLSYELFLFAALMGADMFIFAILAYFYKYVKIKTPSAEELEAATAKPSRSRSNESNGKRNESSGKSNEAYEEETDFNK